MWGVAAPDLGGYPVDVQFSSVVAGVVVAAQMMWYVDPILSTGWLGVGLWYRRGAFGAISGAECVLCFWFVRSRYG
jgi:hypothetical protein